MTFEEWCNSKSKAGFQTDTKQFMELAWNAAIASSLNAAEAQWENTKDGGDAIANIFKAIQQLKTK